MTNALKSNFGTPINPQSIFNLFKTKIVRISFLLILQVISWKTTVTGAEEIFTGIPPFYVFNVEITLGMALGTGVQAILLWLFLAGESIIKPRQKLYALIAVYTAISIYASFFYTYQGISGEQITIENKNKIELQSLKEIIEKNPKYKEAKSKVDDFERRQSELKAESKELRDRVPRSQYAEEIKEIDGKIATAQEDFNKTTYRGKYESAKEAIEIVDGSLKTIEITEKSLDDQSPDSKAIQSISNQEVIKSNQEVIKEVESKLDPEILNQVKPLFSVEAEKLREETNSYFFLPIERLLSFDSSAIVALFLASIADLTSLLLGTAEFQALTEKEKEEGRKQMENFFVNPVKSVCLFIPSFIEGFAHFIFVLIRSFGELVNGLLSGLISARKRSFQAFVYTPNKVGVGKDADKKQFFLNIRSAIFYKLNQQREETAYLDFEQLISDCGSNFVLIEACHKTVASLVEIGWIKRVDSNGENSEGLAGNGFDHDYRKSLYRIEHGFRDSLLDWLNLEERSMCQQRELDNPSASYTNLVYLPSHYTQDTKKKAKYYSRRVGWVIDKLFT
jgi:hypothetical protein